MYNHMFLSGSLYEEGGWETGNLSVVANLDHKVIGLIKLSLDTEQ